MWFLVQYLTTTRIVRAYLRSAIILAPYMATKNILYPCLPQTAIYGLSPFADVAIQLFCCCSPSPVHQTCLLTAWELCLTLPMPLLLLILPYIQWGTKPFKWFLKLDCSLNDSRTTKPIMFKNCTMVEYHVTNKFQFVLLCNFNFFPHY